MLTSPIPGRVALACSGIGHVNRGYEASVAELYNAISGRSEQIDFRLYQGKGNEPGKRSLTTIGRRSALYRIWPLSKVSSYSRYRNENLSFAVHFVLSLLIRPVDIIFTPDHTLAFLLNRIRSWLPRKPVVVFSNGAPFENEFCDKFSAIHQKSFEHYDRSTGTDLQAKSWLIPNGFDAQRLQQPDSFSRSATLSNFNIDPHTTVVLALAAHNKSHKRVDWLLHEFSKLPQENFSLVIAGQTTDDGPELKALSKKLGCNATFVTVPQNQVPDLVWASDLMTLCSLSEGFPRSVAESMGGARHIFVHPHDNAKWIIGDNDYCFVDMKKESALANALQHAVDHPELVARSARKNHQRFLENYTWERVADQYADMFGQLLEQRQLQVAA